MDDPVVKVLLSFLELDFPRTPKSKQFQVNYDKIIGGDLTQEVRDMLQLGTQQRRLLVQGLSYAGSTPDPQNVIESVLAYLPSVWSIQKSLEYSKDTKIRILSPLHFEWNSGLLNPLRTDIQPSQAQGVFVFEVGVLLAVLGISHYNKARSVINRLVKNFELSKEQNTQLSEKEITESLKSAINSFRTGAGVLEFSADDVLVHWKKVPAEPIPETRPKVLKAMATYFLVCAQKLLIAKSLLKWLTESDMNSLNLLPKLFLGLQDKTQILVKLFSSSDSEATADTTLNITKAFPLLNMFLLDDVRLLSLLSETLALKYTANFLAEEVTQNKFDNVQSIETQFALAVGFMSKASTNSSHTYSLLKAQGQTPTKTRVGSFITEINNIIIEESIKYTEENNKVYFGRTDLSEVELPPKSQHRFIVSPIGFSMPQVKALSFEQIIRAPPNIDQNTFNQLPKEIQNELLEQHKQKLIQEKQAEDEKALAEKKSKKKGFGIFGGKSKEAEKKVDKSEAVELIAPPNVDKSVFNALPFEMKVEVINDYNRNNKNI